MILVATGVGSILIKNNPCTAPTTIPAASHVRPTITIAATALVSWGTAPAPRKTTGIPTAQARALARTHSGPDRRSEDPVA